MPNRYLRQDILLSERVNQLDNPSEVFYRRLMSVVDDFGRFDARPVVLKGALYTLRLDHIREADITRWLATCEKAGLIALYDVDAKPFLVMHRLGEPRAKVSKYPPPPPTRANICSQSKPDAIQPEKPAILTAKVVTTDLRAQENICLQTNANAPITSSITITPSITSSITPTSSITGTGVTAVAGYGVETDEIVLALPDWALSGCPLEIRTAEFKRLFAEWFFAVEQRSGKPPPPISVKHAVAKCGVMGLNRSIAALKNSLENNYAGIVEPKNGKHQTLRAKPTAAERGEFAEPDRPLPEFIPRPRAIIAGSGGKGSEN